MIEPRATASSAVRHVVAVASGKGGVGKSTVSLNVAVALAEGGARVGLLDADFYGPDIPVMVNLKRTKPRKSWALWQPGGIELPPVELYGLKLMSVGFLLGEHQSFPGSSPTLRPVLRQFMREVDWGPLEYLIVDLPPGTADLQQTVFESTSALTAMIVVTPQDVAHLDAKKVLDVLAGAGVDVIGAVENMAGFACPHCGEQVELFPAVADERSIWAQGVERLGSVPFNRGTATAAANGIPLVVREPKSAQAQAFRDVAARLAGALDDAR